MNKFFIKFIMLFFAVFCFVFGDTITLASAATTQDRINELHRQIEALERQAKQYRGSITETQQRAKTLKNEIDNLKLQISRLESEMALTGKKIDKTEFEIDDVKDSIFDTQQNIDSQKESIANLLIFLHKRDQESLVGVMMKSNSLSEYLKHEQYALTVNDNLVSLVNNLKETEQKLTVHKGNLEQKKQELESFKQQQNSQRVSLAGVKLNKDTLLVQTKGQEAQYQKLLSNVEAQKAKFFNELRKLESEVVAGGLYLVHVKATSVPRKGLKAFRPPEDGYRLTQNYGMTAYARRGAYGGAPHNGIDMASGYGSEIMSIGDGEVIAAGNNDGWGNWIAVKHPPYNLVSVYGHMSSFAGVRVGSQVKAGQVIGYEGSTGKSTGSHVHLSLYREFFTYQNARKNGQLYFNYFEGSLNPLDYM